jgi:tRNA-2-methylthio-N6-dimethylallyladenosine synthase
MNRKYTVEQYLEKVATFRERCPGWALSTDIIVGFPTETEQDVEKTIALCEQVQFAQAFMFIYSPRRGTPAAHWEQVPPETGNARLLRVAAVVDRGMRALHESKVGTTVRALVQGPSRKDASKIAAKTVDNVTIVAANAPPEATLVRSPWIDVAVEAAHVWGCDGRAVGVAERFAGAATPLRQTIDLVTRAAG